MWSIASCALDRRVGEIGYIPPDSLRLLMLVVLELLADAHEGQSACVSRLESTYHLTHYSDIYMLSHLMWWKPNECSRL